VAVAGADVVVVGATLRPLTVVAVPIYPGFGVSAILVSIGSIM
jgi:hypothetical protein